MEADYSERNARVTEYLGLVKPIARRIARSLPPSFEVEDLEQYGVFGLIAAAMRYDPAREASFRAYCIMKIRGAILEAVSGREYRESSREDCAVRRQEKDWAARGISPETLAGEAESSRRVAQAMAELTPRQGKVIQLRYRKELTQRAAGRALGISQEGARLLEIRAINRLKRTLAA